MESQESRSPKSPIFYGSDEEVEGEREDAVLETQEALLPESDRDRDAVSTDEEALLPESELSEKGIRERSFLDQIPQRRPGTLSLRPETLSPRPGTLSPRPGTLSPGPIWKPSDPKS
mgnify:CR=1 FL=1